MVETDAADLRLPRRPFHVVASLPFVAASQTGQSLDVASYTAEGRLEFPDGTDRWILLGTGLGGDYNEEAFDPADPGTISVVKMEPQAYDYFLENGRYADGSMFLLSFFATQEKPEPQLRGFVQGEAEVSEIHVVDRRRFAEEGRGFFVFQTEEPAPALPVGSECVVCHSEHGDFDATFTQFYPTIRHLVAD